MLFRIYLECLLQGYIERQVHNLHQFASHLLLMRCKITSSEEILPIFPKMLLAAR